jgi:hypothetical protein
MPPAERSEAEFSSSSLHNMSMQTPSACHSPDGWLSVVAPVHTVRDLSIFDDSLNMIRTNEFKTVSRYFAALRQLRHVHRLVLSPVSTSLINILELSRLNHTELL